MKKYLKKYVKLVLGDYSIYRIYRKNPIKDHDVSFERNNLFVKKISDDEINKSTNSIIRDQIIYGGDESLVYACYEGDEIVGLCFYWYGERYKKRNFWPLKDNEAKLVQVITLPNMRGQGVAPFLIEYSSTKMFENGYTCLYARIWHSNHPSIRAFEKNGWEPVARVIEINPFRLKKAHKFKLNI